MKNRKLKAGLLMTPRLVFKGIYYFFLAAVSLLMLALVGILIYDGVVKYGIIVLLKYAGIGIGSIILLSVGIIIAAFIGCLFNR